MMDKPNLIQMTSGVSDGIDDNYDDNDDDDEDESKHGEQRLDIDSQTSDEIMRTQKYDDDGQTYLEH